MARTLALWRRRDELVAIRDRLPAMICHHDATRRNLLLRKRDGRPGVIAIDWQFLGLGRLGDEPAAALLMGLGGAGIWFAAIASGAMSEATVCAIVGRSADDVGRQWNRLQRWLLDLGEHALRRAAADAGMD